MQLEEKLESSKSIPDIFEVVKEVVRKATNSERAGLMLGLAEMGGNEGFWIGAFYPVGTNMIVMNKTPLRKIVETNPKLFNAYCFHILLHEYLHSLGILDENTTRRATYEISRTVFGDGHIVTEMAKDIRQFLPYITYPESSWAPPGELDIELVEGFDRSSITYIR
ncbi:MAG: hypothetical protein Sv326_0274 [Candidatus Fermentimicrarchaeum limneticum]|uniref:Metallopeptidase n=1 Tax=Fermentimicrarchaeum limneticum TaxID=2795018 RepID=A0A7D5XJC5_FERL1|nr:MAG: hypothetical protein Sv326_0274 [Candidatus Fermentimicrarchaeum limneticum]